MKVIITTIALRRFCCIPQNFYDLLFAIPDPSKPVATQIVINVNTIELHDFLSHQIISEEMSCIRESCWT